MAIVSVPQDKFKALAPVSLALFPSAHYVPLRQHAINANLPIHYLQIKQAVFVIKPARNQEMLAFVPQTISNITIPAICAQLLTAYHALRTMFATSA